MSAVAQRTVAVIVADIGNPFHVDLTRGLATRLEADDVITVIGDCRNDTGRQLHLAQALLASGAEGLVVTAPHAPEVLALDVPLVAIDRPPSSSVPYVGVDNVLGGRMATEHLIRAGYARIGIIYADEHLTPVADRLEGYRAGLERQGRDVDAALEIRCDSLDHAGAYAGALRLFDAGADAVFAISDVMAAGALAAATDRGLDVPGDLGIVGYDDTPMAAWPTLNLTSVAQRTGSLGEQAATLLLRRIDAPRVALSPVVLPPQLTVRGSTRPV